MTAQQTNRALDLILQQAVSQHQAGQLAGAEQLYRQILQSYPGHIDANYNLGLIAARNGFHDAALQHFRPAYEAFPTGGQFALAYANALLNCGYLLESMKIIKKARQSGLDGPEFKAAQRTVDEAIRQSIAHPDPGRSEWDSLADLYRDQKWPELEVKVKKLSAQYPRSARVWTIYATALRAQGRDFLPAKRKAAQFSPSDLNLQAGLALDLREAGLTGEAEALCRNAVKNNPDHAEAHFNLGAFLLSLDRVLEAGVCLRRALEIKPDFIRAHCELAVLMHRTGSAEQAADSIRCALEIDTRDVALLCHIGQAQLAMQQPEQAGRQFNRALEINPQHPEALLNMGIALRLLGLFADAEKCFLLAVELYPDFAVAHNNLGLLLQDTGATENALRCYHRAVTLIPNFTNAYQNAAALLLRLERFAEALECLNVLLRLTPADPLMHCNLGLALQGLGQPEPALQSYQNAIARFPGFAFAHGCMGGLLARMGRMEQAGQALTTGLAADPTDPRVLALALMHLPYAAQDSRFAGLETVYAGRERYETGVRVFLCRAYAKAMQQAGETDKAQAAQDEADSLTLKAQQV